jgi:hypothetical protein
MRAAPWLIALATLGPAWCMSQPAGNSAEPGARLQVWIETQPGGSGPTVVLPYVKSPQAMHVHYSLDVAKQGVGGSSRVSQQGTITAPANEPALLTRVTLGLRPEDDCRIELVLDDPVALTQLGRYSFKCQ